MVCLGVPVLERPPGDSLVLCSGKNIDVLPAPN